MLVHSLRHFSKPRVAGSSVEEQENKILISGFLLRAHMSLMWIQLMCIFVQCSYFHKKGKSLGGNV